MIKIQFLYGTRCTLLGNLILLTGICLLGIYKGIIRIVRWLYYILRMWVAVFRNKEIAQNSMSEHKMFNIYIFKQRSLCSNDNEKKLIINL